MSRVMRDCVSGGRDSFVARKDLIRLRNIASICLISFASSIMRFSSVASRDEIRVAAFSSAAAASRSSRSTRSASRRIRSLSSRSAASR